MGGKRRAKRLRKERDGGQGGSPPGLDRPRESCYEAPKMVGVLPEGLTFNVRGGPLSAVDGPRCV